MNREPGIEIRDLSYAYGTEPALQEVSLQVSHACFTALLGPNGAGKSTLVALLCGLIVPERGQIEVLGLDLGHRPRAALERMGLVFQPQTLDLDLTVRQNMAYFAALRGLSGADAKRRIETCLERLELAERGGEKARSLSGGHRRRLEIARALLHAPRLLILDEPTVGLDVPSRAALVQHVHALCAEDGLTVLWATHLVDEVWDDDRLVVLHRGRIRAAGPVREILSETGCSSVLEAFTDLTTEPL